MADAAAAQDLRRWVGCAVALTRLPAVGSEVYYFPEGHADQWPSVAAPVVANPMPMVACTVASIQCFTNGEEPYARITLLPAGHNDEPAADTRPDPDSFRYYAKVISQSDFQRSYLVVPKPCVESLFPALQVGNGEQALQMLGLNGEVYDLVHKAGPMHQLSGDWASFVKSKRLGVGDKVVFIRRSDPRLLMGARLQDPLVDHEVQPLEELVESMHSAAAGNEFTVTYIPGRGRSPFFVPRGAVDQAMGKEWHSGMEVRTRPEDMVLHVQEPHAPPSEVVAGTIAAVTAGSWRNLEIDFNVSGLCRKNSWDVDAMPDQPPAPKRLKTSTEPTLPGDDQGPSSSNEPVKAIRLFGSTMKPNVRIDG